ncbi:MAG: ribose 5-phosphate isomerase B [Bacteroidetes bacterium]|nr:ribose 5-phosphate isomerase B [Bacteroidota bacterium]
MSKIAIGCDHAAFQLKEKLKAYLSLKGHEIMDFGCYSEERADYPDYGHAVAKGVESKEFDFGLLMCGSGNGINMTANKHRGVRSALCWNAEIAMLARQHNDANILTLPARFISEEEAKKCVDVFYSTTFEGGRHADRVKKIAEGC